VSVVVVVSSVVSTGGGVGAGVDGSVGAAVDVSGGRVGVSDVSGVSGVSGVRVDDSVVESISLFTGISASILITFIV
jgi:hypothetical protein